MPRYLISFDAHAMDHIPDEDMPAVANASHAVVQEAMDAGVWVFGGGLENQKASIVADGAVADGSYPEAISGLSIVDVPSREEALKWAAKIAVACRCAQEVRGCPEPGSAGLGGGKLEGYPEAAGSVPAGFLLTAPSVERAVSGPGLASIRRKAACVGREAHEGG